MITKVIICDVLSPGSALLKEQIPIMYPFLFSFLSVSISDLIYQSLIFIDSMMLSENENCTCH